jgi:rhodanese-related sulfurtransferase
VHDGDEIRFGQCRLSFLETPGHTLESVCVVLDDLSQPGPARAVFTGDTLFVGDVGRPDLSPTHTPQQLAAILYSSLHDKLLKLPEETVIYPAHGAGSLCGRQMSSESSSTIGQQKRTNYALLARSREEFVQLLTDNMPDRPEYFAREVDLNRQGASAIADLPPLRELSAADLQRLQAEGAVVVDTRPAIEFAVAHVPGSVHIALTGQYASWAARVLGLDTRLILISEDAEQVRESQIRLARVGIENVAGYLGGGVAGWIRAGMTLEYIPQLTVTDFAELRRQDPAHITVLDVREPAEVASGAIPGSVNIPLGQLAEHAPSLPQDQLIVVHCKGGYRSSIASSLLRRAGFEDIANLTGGYDAWKALEPGGAAPVCQSAG